MPIHLPAPAPTRPADGKGFNRLSLNAHIWTGSAQCALMPTSYPTLFESYDTRRARWGRFGPCTQHKPDCETCPVLTELGTSTEQITFNSPHVLVRIDTSVHPDASFNATPVTTLWMTDQPEDPQYHSNGQKWTWRRILCVKGWELGRRHRDEIGDGFWLHRTAQAPSPPHVEVRTKARQTSTRHAFFVNGTRAALLTCYSRCRHDEALLNSVGHHTPEHADDDATALGWSQPRLPQDHSRGRHLNLQVNRGACSVTLTEGSEVLARLEFSGSSWTAGQVQNAAAALTAHTGI